MTMDMGQTQMFLETAVSFIAAVALVVPDAGEGLDIAKAMTDRIDRENPSVPEKGPLTTEQAIAYQLAVARAVIAYLES